MRYPKAMSSIADQRTGVLQVVLALVLLLGFSAMASAEPVAHTVSHGNLLTIDVETGVSKMIGPTGLSYVPALTWSPDGVLYGVGWVGDGQQLVVFDESSGAATAVGPLGVDESPTGLTFDPRARLWMTTADALYLVDSGTGAATLWSPLDREVTSLTARGKQLFVFTDDDVQGRWLEELDVETGELVPLWDLSYLILLSFVGSSFDGEGTLRFLGAGPYITKLNPMSFFKMEGLETGEVIETFSDVYHFMEPEAGMANMALPQWPKLLSARR